MTFPLFKIFSFSKRCLGIDIGSSSIKIIELSRRGKKTKLENYIEVRSPKGKLMLKREGENVVFPRTTAKTIRIVLDKVGIKTKRAVFTLPDYSTLFTWFELPLMTKEEIPEAVKYEARHHSPLPRYWRQRRLPSLVPQSKRRTKPLPLWILAKRPQPVV